MIDAKTWYCWECRKWWDDMQVLSCCQSVTCDALVCPDCEEIVSYKPKTGPELQGAE